MGSSFDEIDIDEFDRFDFLTFLNCLVEGNLKWDHKALDVFPIACKYEAEECIKLCAGILKPGVYTDLDKNLCKALNLSLFYKHGELSKNIINYFDEKNLIQKAFYDEKCCFELEPNSVFELLAKIDVDSFIVNILFIYARNYLKKNKDNIKFKDFFKAYGIDSKIKPECFETVQCILQFNESELGLDYFSPIEILDYVKTHEMIEMSEWVVFKKDETLTEIFTVDSENCHIDLNNFDLHITRNKIVFFDKPQGYNTLISWVGSFYKGEAGNYKESYRRFESNFRSFDPLKNCEFFYGSNTKFSDVKGDLTIEISYTFQYDCRILKKSFRSSCIGAKIIKKVPEDLYFTSDVVISKR